MAQLTLGGASGVPCMYCTHTAADHDEYDGCRAKVEGYDGMGTCPCTRYKESS